MEPSQILSQLSKTLIELIILSLPGAIGGIIAGIILYYLLLRKEIEQIKDINAGRAKRDVRNSYLWLVRKINDVLRNIYSICEDNSTIYYDRSYLPRFENDYKDTNRRKKLIQNIVLTHYPGIFNDIESFFYEDRTRKKIPFETPGTIHHEKLTLPAETLDYLEEIRPRLFEKSNEAQIEKEKKVQIALEFLTKTIAHVDKRFNSYGLVPKIKQ